MIVEFPDQVSHDAERLIERLGDFALPILARGDDFFPVGAAVTVSGDIDQLAIAPEVNATVGEAIEMLWEFARDNRDKWRSVCIVFDVAHAELGDALAFRLDFADFHVGMVAYLPYRPARFFRKFEPREVVFETAPSFLWD